MQHWPELKRAVYAISAVIVASLAISVVGAFEAVNASDTAKNAANVATREGERSVQRADRAANRAAAANHAAVSAHQLAAAIQQERRDAVLAQCHDENGRHYDTIRQLNHLLSVAEHRAKGQRRRFQIQQSRAPTVLLIDALAPYQNCEKLAKEEAPR